MKPWSLCCLMLLALVPVLNAQDIKDLKVLPARLEGVSSSSTMMHTAMMARINDAFVQNEKAYEQIKTPEQITAWQERMRALFTEHLGGFPARTPLKPHVTAKVDKGDYRLEKVTFESQPGHTVTALLYLPTGKPPFPGVLVPCGHSATGKAYEAYQQASILLARNGMVALCFDPLDQGERAQLLDEKGNQALASTKAHSMVNVGACLVGRNTATYEIWDGMRAIDYLLTRPEVDPKRIGCTGISGGGTQTAYLMALDLRIVAAAPGCYLTSFPRLLEKAGSQDAEQNIFGQIRDGLDHAEFISLRAPLPTMVLCATRDFFDINGTWESFRKAKRIYARLDRTDCLDISESDEAHGFTAPLRSASVRFFRRWFFNSTEIVPEPPKQPVLEPEEAWCTPKGQVILRPGERTAYELNAEEAERLAPARHNLWQGNKAAALAQVRLLTGIRPLSDLPRPAVEKAGTVAREGYTIQKLILRPEPGIWLPAIQFTPPQPTAAPVLYLNGAGKQIDAAPGGPIENLFRQGHTVLAVDLRGLGETVDPGKDDYAKIVAPEWRAVCLAYKLGTSYLAMRAEDVLVCARYLGEGSKVDLIATGVTCPPALHAAALEPQLFGSLSLRENPLESYDKVAHTSMSPGQYVNCVFGALKVYDLPDLQAALPSGMLKP